MKKSAKKAQGKKSKKITAKRSIKNRITKIVVEKEKIEPVVLEMPKPDITERNAILVSNPELEVIPKKHVEVPMTETSVKLLVSANIFGFQFRKETSLYIDKQGRLMANYNYIEKHFNLDCFDRSELDFIREAHKANLTYLEVQKNGKQPNYSIDFENPTDEPLTCTLFGLNEYLFVKNYGSDAGLIISPSQSNLHYAECLHQSSHIPFKTKVIKILSENFNQVHQDIMITSKDANGIITRTPLNTKSYLTDETKNVLPIFFPIVVDGGTNIKFTVLPKTKGTILFYNEKAVNQFTGRSNEVNEQMITFMNALTSCQIQQGLNYVSIPDVEKFLKISINQTEISLSTMVNRGMIKMKEENGQKLFGLNFRLVTVSGKTINVDLLTALKKSEFDLNK